VSLEETLGKLAALRLAIRKDGAARDVHRFASLVDGLGYTTAALDPKIGFKELVKEARSHYEALLSLSPDDAVALNNLGVLLTNDSKLQAARPYLVRAALLAPKDATIQENRRLSDVMLKKPRDDWHSYPAGLTPGIFSLQVYFDPHAA
jgi:hypothetical protein